jgi:hypothetical protein
MQGVKPWIEALKCVAVLAPVSLALSSGTLSRVLVPLAVPVHCLWPQQPSGEAICSSNAKEIHPSSSPLPWAEVLPTHHLYLGAEWWSFSFLGGGSKRGRSLVQSDSIPLAPPG